MFFSFLLLESLDEGTSPPRYLVDGLKELVYSFKEWTRTREVRTGWDSPRGEGYVGSYRSEGWGYSEQIHGSVSLYDYVWLLAQSTIEFYIS